MKATLYVDGNTIEMNPFIESYLANICKAILNSLKGTQGAQKAVFRIKGKNVEIVVNDNPLDLHIDRGFAGVIVRDTILEVLTHLRGIRGGKEIEIEVIL
jgi:hypothetical protein